MAKKSERKPKTTVKRQSRSRSVVKKLLVRASDEHIFWCNDGRTFRDLKELAEGLNAMSQETFYHHVTQVRNDFSNWVRDVIHDEELARSLGQAVCKEDAAAYVTARLDFYES